MENNRCPSEGWQAVLDQQEMPETCPICGKPNVDDSGDWSCPAAEGFCSVACAEQYRAEFQAADEAYANSVL